MPDEILLVASANGLGHARRLMYIYEELLRKDIRAGIVLNESQFSKCKVEFPETSWGGLLVTNSKYGLDGPHAKFSTEPVDLAVLDRVANAQCVLSDNVFWPTKYNSNFFMHGHFTWVDYWSRRKVISQVVDELPDEENLIEKVRGWFKASVFGLSESLLDPKAIPMPLIRYPSDIGFEGLPRNWSEIWVSVGTTDDRVYSNFDFESLQDSGFQIRFLETYNFLILKTLPGLVIGRPGLGTLRDCLASGTPFLEMKQPEIEGNHDPELASNLDKMSTFGLLVNPQKIHKHALGKLSNMYREFWAQNSAPVNEYSNKMLTIISGMEN
jgi:hypothetical protein